MEARKSINALSMPYCEGDKKVNQCLIHITYFFNEFFLKRRDCYQKGH